MTKETKEEKAAAEKQMASEFERLATTDTRLRTAAARTAVVSDAKKKRFSTDAEGVVKGKAYYVLKAPHYRDAVLYPAGTVVMVEDEKPSQTWRRVKSTKGAVALRRPEAPAEAAEDFDEESEEVVPVAIETMKPNPGGIAPSVSNPASTQVVVGTSPSEAAKAVEEAKKTQEAERRKGRPNDKEI